MRISLAILLVSSLALASCGWRDSRVNPRNWFGKSQAVAVETEQGAVNPLIPARRRGVFARPEPEDLSVPIASVTELSVEPTNTGAIIVATGVAERQGPYEVRLVPDSDDLTPQDGVLSFSFRVLYPRTGSAAGSEFTRTVRDGYSISSADLEGVRAIRVSAAGNALETRRR